jgi:hypothetical protein
MTGVQPKMSALLATDVRATPPRKRAWYRPWPTSDRPMMAGQSPRATPRTDAWRPSRHAITARKRSEASTIRMPLSAGPGSSCSAALSTVKLLPQKNVMRSSHASRRVKRSLIDPGSIRGQTLLSIL